MIKAVIYDLDDLMVNSDPLHEKAHNLVLKKHIGEELPEEMAKRFVGMRVIEILEEIINHYGLDLDLNELFIQRNKIFLQIAQEQLELMPGLMHSLDFFKENNYQIALASSGTKEYINMVLDKFSLRGYFEAILTGDDVEKGKPEPEVYLKAAKALGLKSSECVVLEDATVGIQAAKSAGCKCIAVKNPNTPPQDLSQADLIINSLEELDLDTFKQLTD